MRYLSEMLGCEVKWDDQTKNIIIKKPKVNPEKPNQPNNNTQIIDTTGFETLPQTVETDKYRLTATYLGGEYKKENPENRNLYLRLTNKTTDKNMRLDQGATVFEINGKKVEYKSIDSTLYDTRWYTKIAYYKDNPDGGDNIEGYIVLPVDIKPGDMIKITTYITIDGQKEKIPVVFKLDMNKIK